MKLSIIIPTYNRRDALTKALEGFCEQSYKDFEIIIVDDGSNDGTREVIQKLKLSLRTKYIFQSNKGPASARNLGIRQSKGDIIFFTSDDIVPSKNLLEEHIKTHQDGKENLAVLGYTKWAPTIKTTPFRKFIGGYHFAYATIADESNVYWGNFYTSNVSIHKSLLEKAGLFDEEFPYAAYEDSEFGYRLHQQGMRMVFNKEAIAFHNHPIDFRSYQETMFYKGKSAVILDKKIPGLKKTIYYETKNPLKYFFKKLILNTFSLLILSRAINFLDKLFIPFPKSLYLKILDYYYIKGVKKNE